MSKKKKTTFVFDLQWHDAIRDLEPLQRLEALEAICEYARTGQLPDELSAPIKALLRLICCKMDDNRRTYEAKCESVKNARLRKSEGSRVKSEG